MTFLSAELDRSSTRPMDAAPCRSHGHTGGNPLRHRWSWCALLVWSLCALGHAAVRAQAVDPSRAWVLQWQAPAGCPGKDAVLRRVRGELGVAANPRPLQVHARIDGPVGERRLRLEMLGEGVRVERELRAGDCTELADAAVLLIAMALDPAGSEPQTELEPEPEPEPRAEPKPQPVLDPEPADVPVTPGWQPPPGPAWSVGAGLGVDGTSLPSVAVGPAVTGELRIWGRMRFGAQLRVWVPRPAAIEGTPSGQLRVLLPVVGLDACYDLLGPSLQTGPCVTSEIGALFARSEAIAQPASQWAPWAAVGAGWMLRIALGKSTQLRILGQLALPLTRDRLWVQTAAQPLVVHRPEPWSLRAGVGIAYTL